MFFSIFALIALSTNLYLHPIHASTQVEYENIIIETKEVETEVPGFGLFEVIATNPTEKALTMVGEILIGTSTSTGTYTRGRCIVYIELQPGSRESETVACQGRYDVWRFEGKAVYDFILSKEDNG